MSRHDDYTITLQREDDGTLAEARLDVVDGDGTNRSIRLRGALLANVADPLRQILSEAGIRGRTWTGTAPITLERRPGERIELLLRAVKPLRRQDRITSVTEHILCMGIEEISYWHAKSGRRGSLRALRVLLTGGGS